MHDIQLLSVQLCGELALTALALLLALACRVAEATARPDPDARIRSNAPDRPTAAPLGRT